MKHVLGLIAIFFITALVAVPQVQARKVVTGQIVTETGAVIPLTSSIAPRVIWAQKCNLDIASCNSSNQRRYVPDKSNPTLGYWDFTTSTFVFKEWVGGGFGCGENPHRATAEPNSSFPGVFSQTTFTVVNNVPEVIKISPIVFHPPVTPTPVTCGGPCSQSTQCGIACPVCGANGTCAVPTPTKIPCAGPCSPGDGSTNPSCNLTCPICIPDGNGGGTCAAPTPTPTPVGCNQSCSNPTQCTINCPICAPNPDGSGSVCKAGCGSPCTNPSQCSFDCPICTAGGTCAAPTPTPIACGQSCNPVGGGINPKCDVTCPICAPDGAGGGKCVAPTPTPIPCGQSCGPEGPGVNPKCDVTCPVCAKGPNGTGVCVRPTPMPTPLCGI